MSPTRRSPGGTATTSSPSTRSASSGSRAASESSAEVVRASERISTQWPSSMMTMRSASSHQNSSSCEASPSVAAQEARNATVIASPMSSIMPGLRSLISLTAPARNGRPPHRYMTVPRAGAIHTAQVGTE